MINRDKKIRSMFNFLPKLKRAFVEPQVYALILESRRGSILHLGIHYSLDEAVSAATPALMNLAPHKPGDAVGVELWTTLKGQDAITALVDPASAQAAFQAKATPVKKLKVQKIKPLSPEDQIKAIEKNKNELMKSLVERGDVTVVESSKSILSKTERKYIIDKINERATDSAK